MNASGGNRPVWWQQNWVFVAAVFLLTGAAYQPVWHAGFLSDDIYSVLRDPFVHAPDGWWKMWVNRAVDYVPATSLTFWAEWHLWSTHPLGYHLDNVFLHGLDTILIWRALERLKIPGAKLAALLFALHPVNVASVAWITERKNTLAMACMAGAVLLYLTFEDTGRRKWYCLAAALFVLGIFAKSAIAPLPVALLGMDWWRRGRITRRDVARSLPFFGLALSGALLGVWIQHQVILPIVAMHESFALRLARAGWIVWFYLGKAVWPTHLIFTYPKWRIDPSNPSVYLPDLLVAAVFLIGWSYRKTWGKALLFGFGFFVLMLGPVLGFVDISFMLATPVADHWQYFAIIGPIALVSAALLTTVRRFQERAEFGLCGALVAASGFFAWLQCGLYVNPAVFWKATLDRNPDSFMAQSVYGNYLFEKGMVADAIAHYKQAIEIAPFFYNAQFDLGTIYLAEHHSAEAIPHFEKAVEVEPDNVEALNNLAWALATCPDARMRDGARAVQIASKANQLSGDKEPTILGTLGAAYAEAGRFKEAVSTIERARKLLGNQNAKLADDLAEQLRLYQNGSPSRD